jgi:hypothetical protein
MVNISVCWHKLRCKKNHKDWSSKRAIIRKELEMVVPSFLFFFFFSTGIWIQDPVLRKLKRKNFLCIQLCVFCVLLSKSICREKPLMEIAATVLSRIFAVFSQEKTCKYLYSLDFLFHGPVKWHYNHVFMYFSIFKSFL